VRRIGHDAELFVDANGALSRKQALAMADAIEEFSVSWFEEPVSSDDLAGLRLIRDRAPAHMDIAAGEYGYDLFYFRRMLDAGAVDVLQADATRCAGITGFLQVGALCDAFGVPLSPTRLRHCTWRRAAHSVALDTSSISTITSASNRCCSTAPRSRARTADSIRTCRAPGSASNSNGATRHRSR
jgi:L-alanine-DL-glutamate epimerase-like enolase superfamily enzyme